MRKIDWETAFTNNTFFFEDENIEACFENDINIRVNEIADKITTLRDADGIKRFIKEEKDSLSILITLLGISGERFNRIVSLIRADYGHVFEGEWKFDSTMRNKLLSNPPILNDVCDLFKDGYSCKKFKGRIPKLILKKFIINEETISRISNRDFLQQLVQPKFDVEYTSRYREAYHNLLKDSIKPIADRYGLEFHDKMIPVNCSYPAAFILSSGNKSIVINASYNLTTGQGQTKYQESLSKMYSILRNDSNVLVINMLDGAGWTARNSDYKQILNNCHHFLNLKLVNNIDSTIKEFYDII